MSANFALGIVTLLCALLLFGRSAATRQWRGEPIARWALVWAAIFVAAFAIAIALGRN